jgi:8-oxo-dGTP pyrophosphatase MutT (NUDIX family)
MSVLGSIVAVIQNGKILLTQREDFEVWCLPGGSVEDGETVAEAAVREVREETGIDVELTSLVGIYSRLGLYPDIHGVLFTATPTSSKLQTQPGETIALDYFGIDNLPKPLLFGYRQRIEDAMNSVGGGVAWKQTVTPTIKGVTNRKDLYDIRDKSGLSRVGFYLQAFKPLEPKDEILEVGPDSLG